MDKEPFKSGFVALIGRPNVGKSTLLNTFVGQKVAIISDKPQTTRHKIQGVYTSEKAQIVFIDTPGIHKPKHKLGRWMTDLARRTLKEVDLILFLVDADNGYGKGDQYIIEHLKDVKTPVFLVVNKIDRVHPDQLLPFIDEYRKKHDFTEIIPISALHGNNVNTLTNEIVARLKPGPKYYPNEMVTDHPEQFIIAELIREQALRFTREEVPHSIAVVIEQIEAQKEKNVVVIQATIVTERPSQKGILIGKEGRMLKKIGQNARKEIENLLGSRVFLELWVKVQKDWRNKDRLLRDFGFDAGDYS